MRRTRRKISSKTIGNTLFKKAEEKDEESRRGEVLALAVMLSHFQMLKLRFLFSFRVKEERESWSFFYKED